MQYHAAATAVFHARVRIAVATAIICITSACTDNRDATSGADAALFSLDSRSSRSILALSTRDSSLTVGDTASISVPGIGQPTSDRSVRPSARFRSTDSTVLAVDEHGLVRAVRVGKAAIFVRSLIGTGAIRISVRAATTVAVPSLPSAASPPPTVTSPPPTVVPANPGNFASFTAPQLPQATVDVSAPATATRTYRIPAGDAIALQDALNAAVAGDEIVLPDGSIFKGSFHLPNRASGGTVVLRSATVPVSVRTRITPSQAGSLATLVTNNVFPALTADDGAHGWRVTGVRMQLADNAVDNYGIVTLGSGMQTSAAQFPRNIVLDRVVVMGSTTGTTSRCVSMNGLALAVVDSWLAECHARGRDAQAIASWTGTGPLLIENNHLEGSGQAVLLGGADPLINGVTPADITIRHNHLFKPLGWAGRWTVKAAFEIKHGERVLFEGNVIENHWADAQVGFAILMQSVSQDGKAPWNVIRDITVRLNAIRNSRSGVDILSRLSLAGSPTLQPSRRILLRDNSFESVGRDPITGSAGRFLQLLGDLEDATVIQNTFFGAAASNDLMFEGPPMVRLAFSNNVFGSATYGILGSGFGEGTASLQQFAPGANVSGNVLTGLVARLYGAGNSFPSSLALNDFVDPNGGNYSLQPQLPFSVLNGARAGVDGAAVSNATSGVTAR